MRKLLKILAIIIVLFIVIIAVAIALVVKVIKPNDLKGTIQQQVHRITGRELIIHGNIHWTFFPWVALQVDDAQLNNLASFAATPFAKLAQAEIEVKLWPLLHHKIEIGQVTLKGLQLNLIKKADGSTNWQNANPTKKHSAAEPESNTAVTTTNTILAPIALTISNVQMSDAKVSFDDQQQHQNYTIDNVQLTSSKLSFDKSFPLQLSFNFSNSPSLSGKLKLTGDMTVNRVQQELTLNNAKLDLSANGERLAQPIELRLQSNIQANHDAVHLNDLNIHLNESTLTGKALFSNSPKQPSTFTLVINNLDINRYIPKKATTTTPTAVATSSSSQPVASAPASPAVAAAAASKEFPTEVLRKLYWQGNLAIDTLKVANMQIQNLKLQLKADKGVITVAPITANFYQGSYKGELTIDARNAAPHYRFKENLVGVQLDPLLQQLEEKKRFAMSGSLDLNADLTTTGFDKDKLLKNLAGPASIKVLNGSLKGIDVAYQVRRAQAFLKKQPEPTQNGSNQTDFGSLTASFVIQQGKANNSDLLLQSPVVKMTGNGSIDLVKDQFNYKLLATVLGSGLDQQTKEVQDFIGGGVPLLVSGNFNHYKVTPDWEILGRAVVKSAIKQHATELKVKVGEKLEKALGSEAGKKLKKQLQGLFH